MPRLKLWPYLGLWAVLFGAQVWILVTWLTEATGLALGGLVLLQLLKVPVAVGRLQDLGKPPDDALLVLIPFANLGLWGQLNERTPSPERYERRRAAWANQMLAVQAFGRGLGGMVRSAPLVVPLGVVFGAFYAGGELWTVETLLATGDLEEGTAELAGQLLGGLAILLGLYTLMQVVKRQTASRASWLPTFFLLPVLIAFGMVTLGAGPAQHGLGDGAQGMGPLVAASSAWGLFWMCIVGATLAVLWVSVAEAQRDGQTLGLDVIGRMLRRTPDVAAPHGGAALAIQIGLQVVIPGIHYALQFAFVDAVAVDDPERKALRRSSQLTRGIRRRIFKVYALGFVVAIAAGVAIALPVELWTRSGEAALAEVAAHVLYGVPLLLIVFPVHLTALGPWTFAAVATVMVLCWGIARTALVHMYWEQAARADAAGGGTAQADGVA